MKDISKMTPRLCPCQSGRRYERCCQPYLNNEKTAPTAEALMRSRYSAFYEGNLDYLIATHHPNYRKNQERSLLERSLLSTQWLHLQILSTHKGQRKDQQGSVEFVAAYRERSAAMLTAAVRQLRERSEFVKENAQWFYTVGETRSPFIPKREQPCWCGSGKAFKRCHEDAPVKTEP